MNSPVAEPLSLDKRPIAAGSTLATAARTERLAIAAFLLLLFGLRVKIAFTLRALGAFSYDDLLFDADPHTFSVTVAHGWGSHHLVRHPGFAALANLPVRGLAAVLAVAGLGDAHTLQELLALVVSPAAGACAGVLWWLAARRAGFSMVARCGGLVLSQLAFSSAVFASIPETYAVSGALLCLLLLLSVNVARDPASMDLPRTWIAWLAVASVMAGVTITNGVLCIAVWCAIRLGPATFRRVLAEAIAAAVIVATAAALQLAAGKMLYQTRNHPPQQTLVQGTSKFMNDKPVEKAMSIPYAYVATVFPLRATRRAPTAVSPNGLMSLVPQPVLGPFMLLGWAVLGALAWRVWRTKPDQLLLRAVVSVLLFNWSLHSLFGYETFLYSQHWLAFLLFGALLPWRDARGGRAIAMFTGAAALAAILGLRVFSAIFAVLPL